MEDDDAMPVDIDFWAGLWKTDRIGFHEGRPNAFLEKHVARFGGARRVMVPLCGKAEDMAFLAARGYEVVGLEAVESAATAFFGEHGLTPEIRNGERLRSYSGGGITILTGDFFHASLDDVGRIDAFYDRAALVALPREERGRYVEHLCALSLPGARGIVITGDFAEETIGVPPFAVGEAEVRARFAGASVQKIDQGPLDTPRIRAAKAKGIAVDGFVEECFVVTLPPSPQK